MAERPSAPERITVPNDLAGHIIAPDDLPRSAAASIEESAIIYRYSPRALANDYEYCELEPDERYIFNALMLTRGMQSTELFVRELGVNSHWPKQSQKAFRASFQNLSKKLTRLTGEIIIERVTAHETLLRVSPFLHYAALPAPPVSQKESDQNDVLRNRPRAQAIARLMRTYGEDLRCAKLLAKYQTRQKDGAQHSTSQYEHYLRTTRVPTPEETNTLFAQFHQGLALAMQLDNAALPTDNPVLADAAAAYTCIISDKPTASTASCWTHYAPLRERKHGTNG